MLSPMNLGKTIWKKENRAKKYVRTSLFHHYLFGHVNCDILASVIDKLSTLIIGSGILLEKATGNMGITNVR